MAAPQPSCGPTLSPPPRNADSPDSASALLGAAAETNETGHVPSSSRPSDVPRSSDVPSTLTFGSGSFAASFEPSAVVEAGERVSDGNAVVASQDTTQGLGTHTASIEESKAFPDADRNLLSPPRLRSMVSSGSSVGDAARGVGVGQGQGGADSKHVSFPEFNMRPSRSQVKLYESGTLPTQCCLLWRCADSNCSVL